MPCLPASSALTPQPTCLLWEGFWRVAADKSINSEELPDFSMESLLSLTPVVKRPGKKVHLYNTRQEEPTTFCHCPTLKVLNAL